MRPRFSQARWVLLRRSLWFVWMYFLRSIRLARPWKRFNAEEQCQTRETQAFSSRMPYLTNDELVRSHREVRPINNRVSNYSSSHASFQQPVPSRLKQLARDAMQGNAYSFEHHMPSSELSISSTQHLIKPHPQCVHLHRRSSDLPRNQFVV
jgi:hypothetical protein